MGGAKKGGKSVEMRQAVDGVGEVIPDYPNLTGAGRFRGDRSRPQARFQLPATVLKLTTTIKRPPSAHSLSHPILRQIIRHRDRPREAFLRLGEDIGRVGEAPDVDERQRLGPRRRRHRRRLTRDRVHQAAGVLGPALAVTRGADRVADEEVGVARTGDQGIARHAVGAERQRPCRRG